MRPGATTASKGLKPPVNEPAPVLFTFAQAARMTALPESWLRRAVTERRIPFRKVGKHVRFTHADLDALVAQSEVPAGVSPIRRKSA